MADALTPVDPEHCQCEIRSAYSPFQLGPPARPEPCGAPPTVVAREPDPPFGEMALCGRCHAVCVQQMPRVTFTPIEEWLRLHPKEVARG